MKKIIKSILFVCLPFLLFSQQTVSIKIITDNHDDESSVNASFTNQLQEEVEILLKSRYEVNFTVIYVDHDLDIAIKAFENAFVEEESDIIIASGPMVSNILAQWSSYGKPAIATTVIDEKLQNIKATADGTSGIDNFTYIQTPFNVKRDMETLLQISGYKKLGVIGVAETNRYSPALDKLFSGFASELGTDQIFIPIEQTVEASLNAIPEDVDAVYLLPLFDGFTPEQEVAFIQGITNKKLPSAALLGEQMVNPGALMGYEAANNFSRIPRRVALDISKILEGQNASDLPVHIPTYNENLLINMATAEKIKQYPSWDMMAEATLLHVDEVETENKWTIQTAIVHALANNLDISIAEKDPEIAEKDVALAKAEYLPQADLSSSLAVLDQASTFTFQGSRGQVSWLASGSVTQLVFSEPAAANIAIQGMLKKAQEAALYQTKLDVILDVAVTYLTVLQAKRSVQIQNENVNVTKRNLDIAKAKQAVGYSGASDINRWESELASANINLNNAQAGLRQARFQLNQLLNRPIDEAFTLEDIIVEGDPFLQINDGKIAPLINNPGDLAKFSDFLVEDAFSRLPEIQQLDYNIDAQNRQLLSLKRRFTLPSLAVSGGTDYLINTWKIPEGLTPIDAKTTWNLGLALQYPLFQGGKRKFNVEKTQLQVLQLEDQKKNLFNQLELLIRANLETVGASYSSTILSREAATSASKNFDIIQDAYSLGQVNVTTLIDAQVAALQTELSAVNALYQFIADFLSLERSTGGYYFLDDEAGQDAYIERLTTFLKENE